MSARKVDVYTAEFFCPGSFFANTTTRELTSLDPAAVTWPDNAYAFCLTHRVDMVDGADTYRGESKQIGPMYYHPASTVETLEQVKRNPKATPTLISNMEFNGWTHVVWTRWGNWPQPFRPGETVVLSPIGGAA